MKKVLFFFFTIIISFNTSNADEEFMTWGVAGSTCKFFNHILNEYGEEGETATTSAFQGFLTGYNISLPNNKRKVINFDGTDYVLSYIKKYCRSEGNNAIVYRGLLKYFETLPYMD